MDALQGVETDVVGLIPWLTRRCRNKFVISHARDDLWSRRVQLRLSEAVGHAEVRRSLMPAWMSRRVICFAVDVR